jgi:hypothetical protein
MSEKCKIEVAVGLEAERKNEEEHGYWEKTDKKNRQFFHSVRAMLGECATGAPGLKR